MNMNGSNKHDSIMSNLDWIWTFSPNFLMRALRVVAYVRSKQSTDRKGKDEEQGNEILEQFIPNIKCKFNKNLVSF